MKITQEISFKGDYRYILELELTDLAKAKPSPFPIAAKKFYEKSKKISDLLVWLSEVVRTIENSK